MFQLPGDMQAQDDDEQSSSHSGMDSSSSPASPTQPQDFDKFDMDLEEPLPKLSPTRWNVSVTDYHHHSLCIQNISRGLSHHCPIKSHYIFASWLVPLHW